MTNLKKLWLNSHLKFVLGLQDQVLVCGEDCTPWKGTHAGAVHEELKAM